MKFQFSLQQSCFPKYKFSLLVASFINRSFISRSAFRIVEAFSRPSVPVTSLEGRNNDISTVGRPSKAGCHHNKDATFDLHPAVLTVSRFTLLLPLIKIPGHGLRATSLLENVSSASSRDTFPEYIGLHQRMNHERFSAASTFSNGEHERR